MAEETSERQSTSELHAITSEAYPQLTRAQRWSVRLIVSIPVLILLTALASGATLYVYLENLADWTTINAEAKLYLKRAAINSLLISIGISVVAGAMGFVVAWQIVRPIKQLARTMESIATGDVPTKLQPLNLGEFGQLGNSFNRMVEQLNNVFEERDKQLRQSFGGTHLVLSREGEILQADPSVRRILGRGAADLVGLKLLSPHGKFPLISRNPALLDTLANLFADALVGKTGFRSVAVRTEGDALGPRFLVSAMPMDAGGERPMQVLIVLRDISGIEGFYEQMQRADRLAAVGTLATGIAHEIRNPLASIRGMLQLMEEPAPDGTQDYAEYHGRMLKEVDRLEKLVHGIMNFAHGEEAPLDEINLNALLRELLTTSRHHAGEGAEDVIVECSFEPDLPTARLQGERLRQALSNLIVNGLQHCLSEGVGPLRIQTMNLTVNPKLPLIICISNPCDALDEDARERLFEPFYTTKPEGTGLGLAIAYQTIAANGGQLEVEYEDGDIQFWVRLPRETQRRRTASQIIPRLDTPLPLPTS